MARARNIKPGFFLNEDLALLGPEAMVLFAGLWCLADREGRLEDRPLRIKHQAVPYFNVDVDQLLNLLANNPENGEHKFIVRYEVNGMKYIQISNFLRHQNPHKNEAQSVIPAVPTKKEVAQEKHRKSTRKTQEKHITNPADSLSPDSLNLIPDSLNSDSPLPNSGPAILDSAPSVTTKKRREEMFNLFWQAYPNKKSKGQAEKAWDKLPLTEILFTLIMSKLTEARSSPNWAKEGGRFIPYPATWLNAKGWEDEYTQALDVPDAWNVLAPYMREGDPNDPKRYS